MCSSSNWKLTIDDDKILWVTLECPGRSANILSSSVREELNVLIDNLCSEANKNNHTKEIKGANILNNATNTAQLGGDGVTLLNASHPLGGGGTASNILATPADLSETSLETLLIQISEAEDDRGIPIALTGQKLIVPPNLVFIAERVLKSNLRPGTADNDINAMRNMGMIPGGVVVNQRLTDTDQYFIMTDCPDGMKHFVRAPIKKAVEGDFETGNLRYKVRERYSFGFTDWRGVYGSEGAA